ncbi:hypothetical protein GS571_03705 [Rhodococcus hoagii]|nr:hypothetical protein [Prescottella equi]
MRIRLGLPGAGSDRHPLPKGDLVIGNDVWIGAGATVLSGIAIGDGAIVGAGSVVSRDVEPYSIVVGNPARVIRKRFSDSQIRDLVEIGWWRWPASVVADRCADLSSQNIDAFIERYRGAPDGRKFTTEPEGRFDPK